MNDEANVVVEPTPLEVILTNLEAVTKAIIMRYGIHPEADATEAASVVIRELIAEQSAATWEEPIVAPIAAPVTTAPKAKAA